MNRLKLAAEHWKKADASRWFVASIAYRITGRHGQVERLAAAIGQSRDTVQRLARAYTLFVSLMSTAADTAPVRRLRRKYHYTRWAIVCESWQRHEFSLDEAAEYLADFDGGNAALENEIENKHGAPEWERRAKWIYKEAQKLDDFAPYELREAALEYVAAYKKWSEAL